MTQTCRPVDTVKSHRGRKPTTAIRAMMLLAQGHDVEAVAKLLGVSINAVFCAKRRLSHNGLKHAPSEYCPVCYEPALRTDAQTEVCFNCGYESDPVGTLTDQRAGFSEPTSLARRDGGLGASRAQDNALIGWLRRQTGHGPGEGLTMRQFEDLSSSGDPALVRNVLGQVMRLGNFRDGDFVVTESVARLARKICRRYMINYAEITRGRIHQIVVCILSEAYKAYGPNRVRLDESVRNEVLSYGG